MKTFTTVLLLVLLACFWLKALTALGAIVAFRWTLASLGLAVSIPALEADSARTKAAGLIRDCIDEMRSGYKYIQERVELEKWLSFSEASKEKSPEKKASKPKQSIIDLIKSLPPKEKTKDLTVSEVIKEAAVAKTPSGS